ncbi:MAG: [protein-PII] uridylyltransferase [Planctomycetaceae bacterium]|nr:[protein-PII] uridylyltransferase [Planctomycetaceae bacterium]
MNIALDELRSTRNRNKLTQARDRVRRLFEGGATGIQAATSMSDSVDAIIVDIYAERVLELDPHSLEMFNQCAAVIAVGGSGRGEVAPYSDVDILFLYDPKIGTKFRDVIADVVRDCWDSGLKLGHSIRTLKECLQIAKAEPQVATSLIEARHLCGDQSIVEKLKGQFYRQVIGRNLASFIDKCVAAREDESVQHGEAVHQLVPDLKRSPGGLRDIHLLRWVAYSAFETTNFDRLRSQGVLRRDDALKLLVANEYLTRLRFNLHFHADKAQELLTFNDQKRLAEERGIEATAVQLPVERLMREYFQHTSFVASLTERFVALHRPRSVASKIVGYVLTRKVESRYLVGPRQIDVLEKAHKSVYRKLDRTLKLFELAAENKVTPSPVVADAIKGASENMIVESFSAVAKSFRAIMATSGNLHKTLRCMQDNGVLERVIPEWKRVRCLLQFNEYHSFTVDEHTLRAIEAVESFAKDTGPVGQAYQAIPDKTILHLAILLHDAGKGFEEDHSDVGRRIAEDVANRLELSDEDRDTLMFLVHKHLRMSYITFHRNPYDPETQINFSREVGSPETLRMLFVLTAADMIAVGPKVWNDWKSELLAEFFDFVMLILSGKHHRHMEQRRLQGIRKRVISTIIPIEVEQPETAEATDEDNEETFEDWIKRQLDAFSTNYLTGTPPERIAADLAVIYDLDDGEIIIETNYDGDTDTFEYRVITHESYASGCSYRIAGALAAKRLEIIDAQISTSMDGIVVDSFRVFDKDFEGEVPNERTESVSEAIRKVLTKQVKVVDLFQRNQTFGGTKHTAPINKMPTRVVFDNNSSPNCTVIDVFAHDRPGLLYTICRTAFNLGLSIQLAKIATHLDQVVDVFYVTDMTGHKITDSQKLKELKMEFQAKIEEFESEGYRKFVGGDG